MQNAQSVPQNKPVQHIKTSNRKYAWYTKDTANNHPHNSNHAPADTGHRGPNITSITAIIITSHGSKTQRWQTKLTHSTALDHNQTCHTPLVTSTQGQPTGAGDHNSPCMHPPATHTHRQTTANSRLTTASLQLKQKQQWPMPKHSWNR